MKVTSDVKGETSVNIHLQILHRFNFHSGCSFIGGVRENQTNKLVTSDKTVKIKAHSSKCRLFCQTSLLSLRPQDKLCLPHHILEEKGLVKVGVTVNALVETPSRRIGPLT